VAAGGARTQQAAVPVVGFLHSGSPEAFVNFVAAFRKGLSETGYVEGQNVAFEFRWGAGQDSGLPELAADLIRRRVAVIVAPGTPAAIAAKAATTTIPIVFATGYDPVALGFVGSLARPGGNLTGISFLSGELAAKRLELVRELKLGATRVAVLVNPALATAETNLKDVEAAARAIGLQIQVLNASTSREIDAAFATFLRERPDALFVSGDPFFMTRRVQIIQLATLHRVPATFAQREFVEAGGLMSYGASVTDAWRQVGVYAGRILKGAKPAELPAVQSSKFELVINAQTARTIGLTVPDKLLVAADEVIE
jgi:putative tryptophan/tyrosine transport system substrate-binding protein